MLLVLQETVENLREVNLRMVRNMKKLELGIKSRDEEAQEVMLERLRQQHGGDQSWTVSDLVMSAVLLLCAGTSYFAYKVRDHQPPPKDFLSRAPSSIARVSLLRKSIALLLHSNAQNRHLNQVSTDEAHARRGREVAPSLVAAMEKVGLVAPTS